MKKIVVLSDTHKNLKTISSILQIMEESDMVIHLGDHYSDMDIFAPILKDKLYRVHGNCDCGSQKEIVIEVEGHRLYATHGDLFGAKRGTSRLVERAKEEGCDIVLYGHSHSAVVKEENGITVINPGTMERYAPMKSFCYLVINGEKVVAAINDNIER